MVAFLRKRATSKIERREHKYVTFNLIYGPLSLKKKPYKLKCITYRELKTTRYGEEIVTFKSIKNFFGFVYFKLLYVGILFLYSEEGARRRVEINVFYYNFECWYRIDMDFFSDGSFVCFFFVVFVGFCMQERLKKNRQNEI